MKKTIASGLFGALLCLIAINGAAQCGAEVHKIKCTPQVSDGYRSLKTYKIDNEDGAKDKVEYSYIFTMGTQYILNLCTAELSSNGIVVHILDSKRNIIATNKINGQLVPAIFYACQTTGIYYMRYTSEEGNHLCAESVLSFKR